VDDGFEQGMTVPFYYDPMIAKMICHDSTRERAIEKTIRAIDEYEITGLETTLGFCRFVMNHQAFRSGNFDTKFVEKYFNPEQLKSKPVEEEELIAGLLATYVKEEVKILPAQSVPVEATSNWKKNRI
jgi:acetyl-CoA carboxylase, biotin carboxylase subunit